MRKRRAPKEYIGAVPINALFAKYRTRLRPPQKVVVRTFCIAVESELGIACSEELFEYNTHSRTLFIQSGGPLKSELLFHKQQLLDFCKEALGEAHAPQQLV